MNISVVSNSDTWNPLTRIIYFGCVNLHFLFHNRKIKKKKKRKNNYFTIMFLAMYQENWENNLKFQCQIFFFCFIVDMAYLNFMQDDGKIGMLYRHINAFSYLLSYGRIFSNNTENW